MSKSKNWDPGARKQEILDCAVKVLNKKIYYKCPVDEIAKHAGIAKGTIYLYFKSKDELYMAVIFNLIDKFTGVIEEVGKMQLPASRQLLMLLEQFSVFLKNHKHLFLSMREETSPPSGKLHQELHKRFQKITGAISCIIEKGVKEKEFKTYPPFVVSSIILSLTSIFAHKEFNECSCDGDIEPGMVFEILMGGLAK